jgi:hypothetical protein
MRLPQTRGPVTYLLWSDLLTYPAEQPLTATAGAVRQALAGSEDLLYDEDLQLALFCLYELHCSGLDGVDERWEWDPGLLALRHELEAGLEARLRRGAAELFGTGDTMPRSPQEVADRLFAMAHHGTGPSAWDFIGREADHGQLQESLVHQSVYRLKETAPYAWALPRLTGRPRAALAELQAGDHGGGHAGRSQAELFAADLARLGLKEHLAAYVDWVPAISLAAVNLRSLFGIHRRLRGATAGSLAVEALGSSVPAAAFARGLERWGVDSGDAGDVAERIQAGAVRGELAGCEVAGGLVAQDRSLADDVFFGAASALLVDQLVGRWQLEAWQAGRSSLLRELPAASRQVLQPDLTD